MEDWIRYRTMYRHGMVVIGRPTQSQGMACLETYLQLIARNGMGFEPPKIVVRCPLAAPQKRTSHRGTDHGKKSISTRDAHEYKPQTMREVLLEHLDAVLGNKCAKSKT